MKEDRVNRNLAENLIRWAIATSVALFAVIALNTPAAYAQPGDGYERCAAENGRCSFNGTQKVAYGANGKYAYKTATDGIDCNNATFGDPIYGTVKACYVDGCLVEFGYVWNTTRDRCMDAAGACNQGFVLNAAKSECDVNQAAVCSLPDSDPLHGLCKGAPSRPKMDAKGCLVEFGYVWNTSRERCMDAAGACNQGFFLNAAGNNCDVNQAAVCALPESDRLHGLCKMP